MADNKLFSLSDVLKEIESDVKKMQKDDIEKLQKNAVKMLQAQAHAMVIEKAQKRLKSTRSQYIQSVGLQSISQNGNDAIWAVTLNKDQEWIEEGAPARNMLENFLASPKAKTAKDGGKYLVIPFKHNKKASDRSAAESKLAGYVQSELKKMGLDKTITDSKGKPILGRAATLNLDGENSPKSKQGNPILSGLTIYQRPMKTKAGTKIARDIMTFRVASSKQLGKGLWDYPEKQGAKIFDEVYKELDNLWEGVCKQTLTKT